MLARVGGSIRRSAVVVRCGVLVRRSVVVRCSVVVRRSVMVRRSVVVRRRAGRVLMVGTVLMRHRRSLRAAHRAHYLPHEHIEEDHQKGDRRRASLTKGEGEHGRLGNGKSNGRGS